MSVSHVRASISFYPVKRSFLKDSVYAFLGCTYERTLVFLHEIIHSTPSFFAAADVCNWPVRQPGNDLLN